MKIWGGVPRGQNDCRVLFIVMIRGIQLNSSHWKIVEWNNNKQILFGSLSYSSNKYTKVNRSRLVLIQYDINRPSVHTNESTDMDYFTYNINHTDIFSTQKSEDHPALKKLSSEIASDQSELPTSHWLTFHGQLLSLNCLQASARTYKINLPTDYTPNWTPSPTWTSPNNGWHRFLCAARHYGY